LKTLAYDRNRVLLFGAAGVAIAALLILAFIPARKEIGVSPTVSLQGIPGYGLQAVKIGEEESGIVDLNISLEGFEVRRADGVWAEVPGSRVSLDLRRAREASFTAGAGGLDAGSYNAIRFSVVRGLEFTNATLESGDVIGVDVPDLKVEIGTSTFDVVEGTVSLLVDLQLGSGTLSNYVTPLYHVALETLRLEFTVTPA
jgi:hypothetical protein